MTLQELNIRIDFEESALKKLREAYIAIVDGGHKSYMIDDRQVTKLDIPSISDEIDRRQSALDNLYKLKERKRPRKAFAIIPKDF